MKLYFDEGGYITANPEDGVELCDFEGRPFDVLGSTPESGLHNTSWIDEDSVPTGWIARLQRLEESIESILADHPDAWFQVSQLKEKFGEVRIYADIGGIDRQLIDTEIDKATEWTRTHCCECGHPATLVSKGWRLPYCRLCAETLHNSQNTRHKTHIPFKSAYNEMSN